MLVYTQKKVAYFLDLDQLLSWIVEKVNQFVVSVHNFKFHA